MFFRRKLCFSPVGVACIACTPRRRMVAGCFLAAGFLFTVLAVAIHTVNIPREDMMEVNIMELGSKLEYLQSLYTARNAELLKIQAKMSNSSASLDTKVVKLRQKYEGSKVAEGFDPKNLQRLQIPILPYVLPHVVKDPNTLRPTFRLSSSKNFADIVIGIPTVKRDKATYWLQTLKSMVEQMSQKDINETLIIIFVGETDMEYVADVAKDIEKVYPDLLGTLIEVLSPSAGYYPDLDSMPETLGDSAKRFKWRSKQNLDAIYLMGYAQSRGTYYLMLEDDVESKSRFMEKMREFIQVSTLRQQHWFLLDFCKDGGIGKLFKSTGLQPFITYVQLFYYNMPIDWLLDHYTNTQVCSPAKDNSCMAMVRQIRLQYKESLFIHKGTFSSLKGKVHLPRGKNSKSQLFFPHSNPPLAKLETTLKEHGQHTLSEAYNGTDFFWTLTPNAGDYIEFVFQLPLHIDRYLFRSANIEHIRDKIYDGCVEALLNNGTYVQINTFDEFGLAEGGVPESLGAIAGLRLYINSTSRKWLIISEIEIVPKEPKYFAHTRQAST